LGLPAAALISRGLTAEVRPFMHTPLDSVDTAGYLDYDYGAQVTEGAVGYLAAAARLAPVRRSPDLNGDGLVDLRDFALLAQHWGQDGSPFDISPAPEGDGVVGVQDLAGLSEYWLNRWSNWWPPFELSTGRDFDDDDDAL
jgi:hypothetical protein